MEISGYTHFGLPGRAAYLMETNQPEKLKQIILEAKKAKLPYFIMAGGSNIVVGNKKYPGLVIVYREGKTKAAVQIDVRKRTVICSCSLPLGELVKLSVTKGWIGLETLTGIPGLVGGALVGNAGAYGHCISEALDSVLIFDGQKERWLPENQCRYAYKESIFKHKNWVLLSAKFKFKKGNKTKIQILSADILKTRQKKFSRLKCAGSWFKNVLVDEVSQKTLAKINQSKIIGGEIPAGYLLEEVGAKGMKMGGLKVTDWHGNLITNNGHATFRDVTKLVKILKDRVYAKFGIKLEEEVRYLI